MKCNQIEIPCRGIQTKNRGRSSTNLFNGTTARPEHSYIAIKSPRGAQPKKQQDIEVSRSRKTVEFHSAFSKRCVSRDLWDRNANGRRQYFTRCLVPVGNGGNARFRASLIRSLRRRVEDCISPDAIFIFEVHNNFQSGGIEIKWTGSARALLIMQISSAASSLQLYLCSANEHRGLLFRFLLMT